MREKRIHDLIEQLALDEVKQRVLWKIKAQQISLFTYVNTDNGYVKQPITLFELITLLSDKNNRPQSIRRNKTHSHE